MSSSLPLAEVLRARGLRLTAQRQLVLEAVYRLGHATPDQVHAAVSKTAAGVNITTVYRTLELLEELGLVTHAHLSHGAPTYHAVGEDQHVHLVCRACGGVDEVQFGRADHPPLGAQPEFGGVVEQPGGRRAGEHTGVGRRHRAQRPVGQPHEGRGGRLQGVPVDRHPQHVLGALFGGPALAGHVDPVRERLRAAEQPR